MMAAVRGCPRARGPMKSCRGADARRTTGLSVSGARDGGGDRRTSVGRSCRRTDVERGTVPGDAARGGRLGTRPACRRIDGAPRRPRRGAHRRRVAIGRDLASSRLVSPRAIVEGLVVTGGTDRRGSGGRRDVGASAGYRAGVGGADRRRSRCARPLRIWRGAAARAGYRAGAVAAVGGARDLLRGAASRRGSLLRTRASALALTQL